MSDGQGGLGGHGDSHSAIRRDWRPLLPPDTPCPVPSDNPCAPGGLSLAVEGPSKAEITCQDNKDGTCTVSYLPTAPGDYSIIVRFDDKHIPGSPFTAKITGETGWGAQWGLGGFRGFLGAPRGHGGTGWPWRHLRSHGHEGTCEVVGALV